METLLLFGFLIIFLGILIKAADFVEETFVVIAKRVNFSEFLLGFLFLGTVTSLPETSILVNSSNEIPELAMGNLIGATLVLFTLVIGISVVKFKNVHFKGKFNEKDVIYCLALTILSIVFLADKNLRVIEGIALIITYFAFSVHLFLEFNINRTKAIEEPINILPSRLFLLLVKASAGVGPILLSSRFIVDIVIEIGARASINEAYIGLLVLAIGTNLPEIVILIRAKDDEHEKLALGNFLGSATFNAPLMGVLAILSGGFEITHFVALIPVSVILFVTCIFFLLFSWTGRRLSVTEGYMLIALYFSFLLVEGGLILFE